MVDVCDRYNLFFVLYVWLIYVVGIFFLVICKFKCKNGGLCIFFNVCKCNVGFYGFYCE